MSSQDHAPIPQQLTREEQERGLRALAEMRRSRQELAAERGGKFTPEGWVLLNESRDQRSRQVLAGGSGARPRVGGGSGASPQVGEDLEE